MALPISRNTTYAPGSQVKSADLNDLQDKVIDLHAGKHGDRTFQVHAAGGHGTNATISAADGWLVSSASGVWWIPLRFNVGDRIRSLVLRGDDTGGSLTMQLYRIANTGTRASVAGPSASSGAWGATGVLSAIDHVVLADNIYYVHLAYDVANIEFAGVGGVYDRP